MFQIFLVMIQTLYYFTTECYRDCFSVVRNISFCKNQLCGKSSVYLFFKQVCGENRNEICWETISEFVTADIDSESFMSLNVFYYSYSG